MVRNWSESEAERDGSEARASAHGRNSASGGDDLKLRPYRGTTFYSLLSSILPVTPLGTAF